MITTIDIKLFYPIFKSHALFWGVIFVVTQPYGRLICLVIDVLEFQVNTHCVYQFGLKCVELIFKIVIILSISLPLSFYVMFLFSGAI